MLGVISQKLYHREHGGYTEVTGESSGRNLDLVGTAFWPCNSACNFGYAVVAVIFILFVSSQWER